MQIRNLGGSGLRVSAVGLGCNNFGQRTDLEASRKVIHKAIDVGITLFDTADIYAGMGGSETVLGTVLGDRRKDIVLATKFSKPMATDGTKQGASRRYIMEAVEASLRRLKTDYIDLYQQHDYDPLTPIEETLRALDDLVRQGKVRYIGNSNFPAWRIAEAEFTARAMNVSRYISCQDEYSLVVRDIEKDLLPAAQQYNLGLLPFFPLASGLLTGKYKRGTAAPDDTRFAKAPALRDRYATRGGFSAVVIKIRLPDGRLYGQTGQLNFVDNTVQQSTDTISVRGAIPNPPLHDPSTTGGPVRELPAFASKPKTQPRLLTQPGLLTQPMSATNPCPTTPARRAKSAPCDRRA